MLTKVAICNLALGYLGKQPIQALDENSPEAGYVSRFYEIAAAVTLRAYDWPFARGFQQLTPLTADPYPGWSKSFAYPASCMFFRGIAKPDRASIQERWIVTADMTSDTGGKAIHCNAESPVGFFTRTIADTTFFAPDFADALAIGIAYRVALTITQEQDRMKVLRALWREAISEAKVNAANESGPDQLGVGFDGEADPAYIVARGS